jgi:hypothetical protein
MVSAKARNDNGNNAVASASKEAWIEMIIRIIILW